MNFAAEDDAAEYPPACDGSFLHFDIFDVNSWIPQTPFYDAPFPDVGCDPEIPYSASDLARHQHAHLSSSFPTKSANQPSTSLLSERRRRGKMKEKLLALRSLVPNITKMDKASIVSDAVTYVKELMNTTTSLEEEIARLQDVFKSDIDETQKSADKKILQMVVVRTDNRQFYIKVLLKKKERTVVGLLQVLESFEHMMVQTINLTVHGEYINLAFTIHVDECEERISETDMKLLLSKFLGQGFGHTANVI